MLRSNGGILGEFFPLVILQADSFRKKKRTDIKISFLLESATTKRRKASMCSSHQLKFTHLPPALVHRGDDRDGDGRRVSHSGGTISRQIPPPSPSFCSLHVLNFGTALNAFQHLYAPSSKDPNNRRRGGVVSIRRRSVCGSSEAR